MHQNYFQTYISSNFHRDANNYSWKASFTATKRKIQQSCSNFPITGQLILQILSIISSTHSSILKPDVSSSCSVYGIRGAWGGLLSIGVGPGSRGPRGFGGGGKCRVHSRPVHVRAFIMKELNDTFI